MKHLPEPERETEILWPHSSHIFQNRSPGKEVLAHIFGTGLFVFWEDELFPSWDQSCLFYHHDDSYGPAYPGVRDRRPGTLLFLHIINVEHTILLSFRFNQKSWLKLAIREWRLEGGGGGEGLKGFTRLDNKKPDTNQIAPRDMSTQIRKRPIQINNKKDITHIF